MEDKADRDWEQEPVEYASLDLLASDRDERVRFALAAARMGVFEWDPTSDLLTWVSRTTGLGLKLEDAPTSGREFFEFVHPDDRLALSEMRDRALRDRTDVVSEFRILAPDGVVHWVQAHGRVVYDTAGTPVRILGVNTDITRRKSLEEQLREAQLDVAQLKVLKATMRTVQDIVSNALMSLLMFRTEAERHVSAESLVVFDHIITDTVEKLRAISNLQQVRLQDMAMGPGIAYDPPLAPGE